PDPDHQPSLPGRRGERGGARRRQGPVLEAGAALYAHRGHLTIAAQDRASFMSAGRAAPLGVFDSGLGGLTVVRALRAHLPSESIVYLGDTARIPYGTRTAATVVRYAEGCAAVLVQHGIKALVVACNTVSAVALDVLSGQLTVPVIGVVEPGAQAAVEAARELQRTGISRPK